MLTCHAMTDNFIYEPLPITYATTENFASPVMSDNIETYVDSSALYSVYLKMHDNATDEDANKDFLMHI